MTCKRKIKQIIGRRIKIVRDTHGDAVGSKLDSRYIGRCARIMNVPSTGLLSRNDMSIYIKLEGGEDDLSVSLDEIEFIE